MLGASFLRLFGLYSTNDHASCPRLSYRVARFTMRKWGSRATLSCFSAGMGGDHRAFSRPQRHFGARFRALAFDSRDAGQSDRADRPYTTADMADDVAGWLEAIGAGPAHVVGQSLGGLVAQELALAPSGSGEEPDAGFDPCRWRPLAQGGASNRGYCCAGRSRSVRSRGRSCPWLVAPPFYRQPAQVEGLVQFAERNPWPQDPEAFARQAHRGHRTRHARSGRADSGPVPGAWSASSTRSTRPRVAAELAQRLPNAKLVVLPGVGHMPHVEDQSRFRQEIERFLDEQHLRSRDDWIMTEIRRRSG